MLSFEVIIRIFSSVMALIYVIFFSNSEITLFASVYFWICMAYMVFLIFKKHIYFWEIGSPLNLFVEIAELIFIFYIHSTSTSQLTLALYLSFIIRISVLYSWKISFPFLLAAGLGNIILNLETNNFVLDNKSLFLILYGIIFYAGTYTGTLVMLKINHELLEHNQQLKETLSIKDTLIKEIDNSREQLIKINEQLTHIANTDGLTGLYNHRYFHDYLDNMFRYLEENEDHISLIMMDLDHFKQYNDTYGHLEGDTILRDLAQILQQCIGQDDVAARYGGDEFAIILPGQGEEEAMKLVGRIKEALEDYERKNPRFINIGVSIGVASNTYGINTKEQLIKQADRNMYTNKNL